MNNTQINSIEEAPAKAKRPKGKLSLIAGGIAAIIVIAGIGLFVWHEQPSFCAAICHTPMDEYLATYEQQPGTAGVDKWGNEVENTDAMLAVSHKALAGSECLDCHVPTLSEQIAEGVNWVSGNYVYPLEEASVSDLTETRGLEGAEFCQNDACHTKSLADLAQLTADMGTYNPHASPHVAIDCSECHKAHRASVMYCTECHINAETPEGWLTAAEAKKLS